MSEEQFEDEEDDVEYLPTQAGRLTDHGFDPYNWWLAGASRGQQLAAMRRWFYDRYEDPVEQTPYNSEEGGYLFVWGGPYDPNDVLRDRFDGDTVPNDVVEQLIYELISDVGEEWAPVEHEVDYDKAFTFIATDRADPFRFLQKRLNDAEEIVALSSANPKNANLLLQMAHTSLIAALEAYLADTAIYWVTRKRDALEQFVSTNKDFKARQLSLTELFTRLETLETEVVEYLRELLWHRLDKIAPMLSDGFGIDVPAIGELMKQVIVRHDVVHRAGVTKDGDGVVIYPNQVLALRDMIKTFAEGIEYGLKQRFPGVGAELEDEIPF